MHSLQIYTLTVTNRGAHGSPATCILDITTVEPPLTTTSKEQPHTIKRPRTQERPPLYSVQRAAF